MFGKPPFGLQIVLNRYLTALVPQRDFPVQPAVGS